MERCPSQSLEMVTNEIRQICSSEYKHYKYKQELSKKGFDEKAEASIKFMFDVWGYQTGLFIAIMIGLTFHKHVLDFVMNKFKIKQGGTK